VRLYRPARIFRRAAQARDVRRRLHLVPGGGGAALHVRRAGTLPQRAPRLSALSDRDADLLPARLADRLSLGLADAGAVFAEHAAAWRTGAGVHRTFAESRR